MEKVCPRCQLPQEGINECEYCGLVFAGYKATKIKKEPKWGGATEKKSIRQNIVFLFLSIIAIIVFGFYYCEHQIAKKTAVVEKERKQKRIEQKRKETERKEKEPLRVTEVPPLVLDASYGGDFIVYFCTNKSLRWKTKHHDYTEVKWSYIIETIDGKQATGQQLDLHTFYLRRELSRKDYKRKNSYSKCHKINFIYQLSRIPFLKHQTGRVFKNTKSYKLRVQERQEFYASITSISITFTDSRTGATLLSFSAYP